MKIYLRILLIIAGVIPINAYAQHNHGAPAGVIQRSEKPRAQPPGLPDLVSRSEERMRVIMESVGLPDKVTSALDNYVVSLEQIRVAVKSGKSEDPAFRKQLLEAETILQAHAGMLQSLSERAPSDLKSRFDEAAGAVAIARERLKKKEAEAPSDNRTSAEKQQKDPRKTQEDHDDHDHSDR